MTDAQQRTAAKAFAQKWQGRGYEKGESQVFWLSLLHEVFGIEHPEDFITFEDQVHLDHTSFIDGYISETRVLIEQKGLGKDLNKAIKQSDGSLLNPFQQAKRYITELPVSKHPRWVITCNFAEFYVYDMDRPGGEPEIIKLADLEKEYYRLQFLVDSGNTHLQREMEISIAAGDIVGLLYDAFYKQYKQPVSEQDLKDLNELCVRLVFCLYAEDAGIFGKRGMFHDYLEQFDVKHTRKALKELFEVLDTKPEDRDDYLEDDLAAFPYVNGGLFAREDVVIPQFTDEIRELLLTKASADFDWSEISPTIFGAVFESTLNPETRRKGGMHYTSIENIHKVIDPLFLNDLKKEFTEICEIAVTKTRNRKLEEFQKKLGTLTFLDPACGSGNFLTETYLSLRRLENDILSTINENQLQMGDVNHTPIQVSISQFYGIEINDFAVTVAKTALWIAESQMMKETEVVLHIKLDFLPLKTNAGIVEGNALRIDWEDVVPKAKLNYIMGNPPFVGYTYQSKEQKADLHSAMDGLGNNLDYVSGWYFKAAQTMQNTIIRTAYVSTNSITQGEQVAIVWKPLFYHLGVHIDFAYQTFRWDSEANLKAQVHCVIIGFSTANNPNNKLLYASDRVQKVDIINPYLINAPVLFIERRKKPICSVPEMCKGSQPTDGGNLIITSDEYANFIKQEPRASKYIHLFLGADEFLNNKNRFCLWLPGVSPRELQTMPHVLERIRKVRDFRLSSKKTATQRQANIPTVFTENRQPTENFIAIPEVSSGLRHYIPMDFLTPDIICSNKLQLVPNATKYHFGVLMSNVHMAWTRSVCGRLKSDYDYSANIVYNNFPWPNPTNAQKGRIEQTAQAILDARALYPDCSLADLYNDLTMPPELRNAHYRNNRAVLAAYGITSKDEAFTSESACVAFLMKLYQKMTTEK